MVDRHYTGNYESSLLRGDEDARPWNVVDEVRRVLTSRDTLLDIGCGTAYKTLELSPLAHRTYGLEPSPQMRAQALDNMRRENLDSIWLVGGKAQSLPFQDRSFDVVTAMAAPHETTEVRRVLRDGGRAVIEKIGAGDKVNIKQEFGADEHGPRGQHGAWSEDEQIAFFEKEFSRHFSQFEIRSGRWATYLSVEGLQLLLEQTPAVRNFDRQKDAKAIKRLIDKYETPRGIATFQQRLLIIATV